MNSERTIIYVGSLRPGEVSNRRACLFEQAGWRVVRVDTSAAFAHWGPVAGKLANNCGVGPVIGDIQAALMSAVEGASPGAIVFFDKPTAFRPHVIAGLAARGLSTVSYMPDNPFGPRKDGIWRLFNACLPFFDMHIVPRASSVEDFEAAGAKKVVRLSFSFDPRFQVPEKGGRSSFSRGYSYTGAAYEQRPEFLLALESRLTPHGIPLTVTGDDWSRRRNRKYGRHFQSGPNLWDEDYRNAIWDSRACLAFVTKLNSDDQSHKAIEIAACGRPPILERAPYHCELFEDGVSAIFFDNVNECAEKLIHYWSRPEDLDRIGAAAARRVREVDHSELRVVTLIEGLLKERRAKSSCQVAPAVERSILFVGDLSHGTTTETRARLFETRAWNNFPLDTARIFRAHNFVEQKLATKLQVGPVVDAFTQAILAAFEAHPHLRYAFFDKPILIQPDVVRALSALGVRTICYTPDDPFGPRRDGVWRLLKQSIPLFDLHIVPRHVSVDDFRRAGAEQVLLQPFSFNPYVHRPPSAADNITPFGYSYIGSSYDNRPQLLLRIKTELAEAGIPLRVRGDGWRRRRVARYGKALNTEPGLYGADYRNAIWRSQACLAFVTTSNRDDLSRKAIEIAACGRAPVLEATPFHLSVFEDGISAVFFQTPEECIEKLKFYWSRPEELARIGLAASAAVRKAGLSEEAMIIQVENAFGMNSDTTDIAVVANS